MNVVYGKPVSWYRLNGWIAQAGLSRGTEVNEWMRYQLVLLGFVLLRSPWVFIGDLDTGPAGPPWAVNRRFPW